MSIQVATQTLGPRFSELVLHELDPRYSRVRARLKANSGDLPFGLVLARAADGDYEPLREADETLGDAVLVLLQDVPDSSEPQTVLALRGYAIINDQRLAFDSSVTKKDEAVRALEARGFVIRSIKEAENAA